MTFYSAYLTKVGTVVFVFQGNAITCVCTAQSPVMSPLLKAVVTTSESESIQVIYIVDILNWTSMMI